MSTRGRPVISEFCVDCFREGKEPPEAKPKLGNSSYCGEHQQKRQNKSKFIRTQRKTVRHGHWGRIPRDARDALADNCRRNVEHAFEVNDAWGDPVQVALNRPRAATEAFEWSCQERAIGLGRRITIAEEDEVIEAFEGSRTGVDALAPTGPGGRVDAAAGKVLLPNPKFRESFRAQFGGPTTEGEPSFTQYHERFFHEAPPASLREEVDPDEVVLEDGEPVLLDGKPVTRGFLDALRKQGLSLSDFRKDRHDFRKPAPEGNPDDIVDDPATGGVTYRKNLPPEDGDDYFNRMNDIP